MRSPAGRCPSHRLGHGINNHYVGTITTVSPHPSEGVWSNPPTVVDGQQRLATLSLLLEAIAQIMPGADAPEGFVPDHIRARFLLDPLATGDRCHKLLLTHNDRDTLIGILDPHKSLPSDPSPRLMENFHHFKSKIARFSTPELQALCNGIARFMIVHMALYPGLDNAQQIFESMNDTGLPLSPSDLIRNVLLIEQRKELQKQIDTDHPKPLEEKFGPSNFDEEIA